MADIIPLSVITTLDTPPERILADATREQFEDVIVIGRTRSGQEYFASSSPDGGVVVWRLERAKLKLLRMGD
jgi:hypothetical protein